MDFLTAQKQSEAHDPSMIELEQGSAPTGLDILLVLVRYRMMIAKVVAGALLLALIVALLLPKKYTGVSKILPPQKSASIAQAVMGQMGILAGSGIPRDLTLRDPNDIYVAMLQSNRVEDSIIKQFSLQKIYNESTITRTRKRLEKSTHIDSGKDGVITVAYEDKSPERAAQIANAYVSTLTDVSRTLAVTEASQRRLFFEQQVAESSTKLAEVQKALQATQEKTGILQLDAQSKVILESIAQLNAQIVAKEVQLSRLRTNATPENAELIAATRELATLREQLTKLQHGAPQGSGSIQVPTANVPRATLEYMDRIREVKYRETMLELLQREYESARIDEAKDATIIQVLDSAIPPEEKSSPKRGLILLVVGALSLLLSVIAAFVMDAVDRASKDPLKASKLAQINRYLRTARS
jgi:tyrosine-protein kinase Etk/Wzc